MQSIQPALHTALLSRLSDQSSEVIRALYSAPQKLASVLKSPSGLKPYISTIFETLPTVDTEVLKLHLEFLLAHVGGSCSEDDTQEIFARILFPLLLFTRDRRAAGVAWDCISSAFESLSSNEPAQDLLAHPLLSGCVEVLEEVKAPLFARGKKQKNKPLEKGDVASMGAVNTALASRMAGMFSSPSSTRKASVLRKDE